MLPKSNTMQIKKFTPELLEAVKKNNIYQAGRIIEAEDLAEEVKKATKYEVICNHYFNEYYYEYSRIIVPFANIEIEVKKNWKGKYEITCPTLYKLVDGKNFTFNELNKIEEQHTKPNNIGKLTEKKFDDWEKYYSKIYQQATKEVKEIKNKVQIFKDEIINSGLPVNWSSETSGEITKNGLTFKFNLINGFPICKMEIHYKVPNTFDSFLKLSDNKYNNVKV